MQIVTKSGGNAYHGSSAATSRREAFEATRKQPDDFGKRFNLQGKLLHQANYDLDAEVGGYVPGFKNKLFFFGSFNPSVEPINSLAQFRNASDLGPLALAGPTQTLWERETSDTRVLLRWQADVQAE